MLRKAALAFAYMLPGRWEKIGYPGPLGSREDARLRPGWSRSSPAASSSSSATSAPLVPERGGGRGGRARRGGARRRRARGGRVLLGTDFDGVERSAFRRLYRGGGAAATDDQGVGLIAGTGLGGGTVVNYTTSFRTPDDVLEEWKGLGFPSAELGASLDAVCERLGVNTDHNRPSARDEAMRRGLQALGWHVEAMPRNVLGCEQGVVCGYCGYGCPVGAKQSAVRTWLEDAAGGGALIVVGAKASACWSSTGPPPAWTPDRCAFVRGRSSWRPVRSRRRALLPGRACATRTSAARCGSIPPRPCSRSSTRKVRPMGRDAQALLLR